MIEFSIYKLVDLFYIVKECGDLIWSEVFFDGYLEYVSCRIFVEDELLENDLCEDVKFVIDEVVGFVNVIDFVVFLFIKL